MNKKFDDLRYRQVHLDFHTSEHIDRVGSKFDEEQFRRMLRQGHVDSVTLFALCHHGWCYYLDSKVTQPHPHLEVDLLPRMLKVCKEENIKAPVYITVGWHDLIGRKHPDWVVKDRDGNKCDFDDACDDLDAPRPWGWPLICLNSPYLQYLADVTSEVMEKFDPSGIFYDITRENKCYCEFCRKSMEEQGVDIDNEADVAAFGTQVYHKSLETFSSIIWKHNPKATLFHNAADKKGRPDLYQYESHHEVESLPSGMWGYEHMPASLKYYKRKGLDVLSMTGKFHTMWGEMGGFKSAEALKYECARILAMGGKCSIGDQLPPDGAMEEDTYKNIGVAYEYVEGLEGWFKNVETVAEIGVLCPSAVTKNHKLDNIDMATSAILLQTGYQYDMLDEEMDFSPYKMLLLPDAVPVDSSLKAKLNNYLSTGGKLLLSGKSGLNPGKTSFQIDCGADYVGPSDWQFDYTCVTEAIAENMVKAPFLNYQGGQVVNVTDADILATVKEPYFNRTYRHFCSHKNTPCSGNDAGYPAVIQKSNVIYIAHDIFSMYNKHGAVLHRNLIENCIKLLLPKKMVKTSLPSCATVNMLKRQDDGNLILNLLYATPLKRGETQVIEDIVTLANIKVELNIDKPIKNIKSLIRGDEIPFQKQGDSVCLTLPQLTMHEALLIS